VFWYKTSNSNYKNRFFESPPTVGFQKTDFGVSSAEGAGNTKIGFIMRIAGIKPLLGLVFNSQNCCHTFVNLALVKGNYP
jgi:hypothetical protein